LVKGGRREQKCIWPWETFSKWGGKVYEGTKRRTHTTKQKKTHNDTRGNSDKRAATSEITKMKRNWNSALERGPPGRETLLRTETLIRIGKKR